MAYLKPNTTANSLRGYVNDAEGAWDNGPGDTSTFATVRSTSGTTGSTGYVTFSGFTNLGAVSTPVINVIWEGVVSDIGLYTGYTAVAILVNGSQVASVTYEDTGGSGTLSYALPEGTNPSTVTVRAYGHHFKYLNDAWYPGDEPLDQFIWQDAEVHISDIWLEYVVPLPTVTSMGATGAKANGSATFYGNFWDISSVTVVSQYDSKAASFSVAPDRASLTFTMPVVNPNVGNLVDIRITNVTGTKVVSNFSLIQPYVSHVTPTKGTLTNPLTITGTNFLSNVLKVMMSPDGGTNYQDATNYTVVSDTQITNVVFPTPVEGAWIVTVVAPNGGGNGTSYSAVAAPTLTSYPSTARPVGEIFSIYGTHFHDFISVTHNGSAIPYTPVSDTEIQIAAWKGMGSAGIVITTYGGSVTTDPIPAQAVSVSIDAVPSYITVGQSHGMSAVVTGAVNTAVTWAVTSGNAHFSGPTLIIDGTGAVTVRATASADSSATDTASTTGVNLPSASLSAAKSPITTGTATTVTPVFSGGSGVINQGLGSVSSGTPRSTGNLGATTTFTLTVTNAAGDSVEAYATVTTVAPASISSFNADMTSLSYGGSTYITPQFSGGVGSITPGNIAVTSGQRVAVGPLSADQRYTLTVVNAASDAVAQNLDISVSQPTISAITADKTVATFAPGLVINCGATVNGAVNSTVTWGGDLSISVGGVATVPAQPASGIETAGSGASSYRAYTITAAAAAKPSVSTSVVVTVYAVPRIQNITTVNISEASLGNTPYGLAPVVRVGADGWFNGSATLTGVGGITLSTDYTLPIVTGPAIYTITVTNPAGAQVTKTFSFTPLTVVVAALAYSVVSGNYVGALGSVSLSTTVTGAASPDVDWTCTGGSFSNVGGTTVVWNAPATPGAYTVTATSKSNAAKSQTATFNVVPAPVISSFTQDITNPVLYGQTVVVTPSYSAQVGKVGATHIAAGGDWSSPNASGVGITYSNVQTGFRTSLSVKNEVGVTAYADLDITVQDVTMVPLVPAYIEAGQQHQFSTSVSGAVDSSVVWSCTGGSITQTGLWTAPTHYGSYTITATSGGKNAVSVATVATVPLQRQYVVKKLTATASSS